MSVAPPPVPAQPPVPSQPAAVAAAPPPPPEPDPSQVEALVAAIGIEPFVSHSLRKVAQYQYDRAAQLPAEIDRKLLRFMTRDEPEEVAPLPDFDFDQVKAWLEGPKDGEQTEAETPEQVQKTIAAFHDGDFALAVTQVVAKIRAYLVQRIPKRIHMSLTGPEEEPPPHVDVARFRRLWQVACDPVGVLTDLNEYALSRDQVAGCADMFPLTWKRMDVGITQVLTHKKTVEPKFHLLRQKETLLRVLGKRTDRTSDQLASDLQALYAAQPAPPRANKPTAASGDKGADSESTDSQRI